MTELWISFLVTIVCALLATTRRIGQIAIVSRATKMTGARDVIVSAEFGFAASHFWRGGRKPPILDREVKEQKSPTGKIYRQLNSNRETYPGKGECPDSNKSHPTPDQFRPVHTPPKTWPEKIRPVGCWEGMAR